MSTGRNKKSESPVKAYVSEPEIFAEFNGVKKRRIFYNVDFTEQEEMWIESVRSTLLKEKGVEITSNQTLLLFYYCADFNMEKCLNKLVQYNKWFTSPVIQCPSGDAYELLKEGFIYSYGNALDGRPFIIMNVNLYSDKYSEDVYHQATNLVINRVINDDFIPGYIQHYYYMIDLEGKMLSLPISKLGDTITKIGNAYTGRVKNLIILNCTTVSKWIFNRLVGFGVISEETATRIKFYTSDEIEEGILKNIIDQNILQQKYGGLRPNINHRIGVKAARSAPVIQSVDQHSETEYFSIEDSQLHYYKGKVCCGDNDQCTIY